MSSSLKFARQAVALYLATAIATSGIKTNQTKTYPFRSLPSSTRANPELFESEKNQKRNCSTGSTKKGPEWGLMLKS